MKGVSMIHSLFRISRWRLFVFYRGAGQGTLSNHCFLDDTLYILKGFKNVYNYPGNPMSAFSATPRSKPRDMPPGIHAVLR